MFNEIIVSTTERSSVIDKSKDKIKVMAAIAKEAKRNMMDEGYDGIFYKNHAEGGVSYIPFRENQIWWLLKDQAP